MNVFRGVEVIHILHALRQVLAERVQAIRDNRFNIAKERHSHSFGMRWG